MDRQTTLSRIKIAQKELLARALKKKWQYERDLAENLGIHPKTLRARATRFGMKLPLFRCPACQQPVEPKDN